MGGLVRVGNVSSPVSLADAKDFARVTYSNEDALIISLCLASTEFAEAFLGRSILNTEWQYFADEFVDEIEIPMPWSSVSKIEYVDSAGETQELSADVWQANCFEPTPKIKLKKNQSWPSIDSSVYNPITITGISGFGETSADVPANILTAIKIQMNTAFNQRESMSIGLEVWELPKPAGVLYLLYPYKAFTT